MTRRKVIVSMVVALDYDEMEAGVKKERWSPGVELAKKVEELPWVYEVISVENLTFTKTGMEFEDEEGE